MPPVSAPLKFDKDCCRVCLLHCPPAGSDNKSLNSMFKSLLSRFKGDLFWGPHFRIPLWGTVITVKSMYINQSHLLHRTERSYHSGDHIEEDICFWPRHDRFSTIQSGMMNPAPGSFEPSKGVLSLRYGQSLY